MPRKMSFEAIVNKILSVRKDLTREKVIDMIDAKEAGAKGFLTRESAARSLALELDIETPKVPFRQETHITDLVSNLGDVTIAGRIISVSPLKTFRRQDETEGVMRRLVIGDKTGEISIVLWDDKADIPKIGESVGRIAKLLHGYVRRRPDGKLELNVGSKGSLELLPENVSGDEYPPLARYTKKIKEITDKEKKATVIGIVQHVYPTSTFERAGGTSGKVRRLELKDESGQITVVLWNEKVDELADVEKGRLIEIYEAKVKKQPDRLPELHVDNAVSVVFLGENPNV